MKIHLDVLSPSRQLDRVLFDPRLAVTPVRDAFFTAHIPVTVFSRPNFRIVDYLLGTTRPFLLATTHRSIRDQPSDQNRPVECAGAIRRPSFSPVDADVKDIQALTFRIPI